MNRGWPAHVRSVQPGGGPVATLAAWARGCRRALLRALRPGYVASMARVRLGSCPGCTHGVVDGRDLLWVQNVCGFVLPAAARIEPFRDRFGLVRLARPELAACVGLGIGLAAALWPLSPWLAAAPPLLPLFALWFFRDPARDPPSGRDLVLAPADGRLDDVRYEAACPFFEGPAWRLGIYLSLFDVHVNRAPVHATVERFDYRRGRHARTARRDSADGNEQLVTWFRAAAGGRPVVVRQIAGPAARRICNVLGAGDAVAAGQRFGLIKFGSRTELWLPAGDAVRLEAEPGQRVRGGVTVLARWTPAVTGGGSGCATD
jgi:phosphatidylserine decarboxylase